jgi:hypothetical protein
LNVKNILEKFLENASTFNTKVKSIHTQQMQPGRFEFFSKKGNFDAWDKKMENVEAKQRKITKSHW